jgi:hypothetical protein
MAFDAQHVANVVECDALAAFFDCLPRSHFNMKRWRDVTPLGTVACIVGWIAELDGEAFTVETPFGPSPDEPAYLAYAARKLGIAQAAVEALSRPPHYMGNWAEITPCRAATVLRRLAATGEVDWSVVQ